MELNKLIEMNPFNGLGIIDEFSEGSLQYEQNSFGQVFSDSSGDLENPRLVPIREGPGEEQIDDQIDGQNPSENTRADELSDNGNNSIIAQQILSEIDFQFQDLLFHNTIFDLSGSDQSSFNDIVGYDQNSSVVDSRADMKMSDSSETYQDRQSEIQNEKLNRTDSPDGSNDNKETNSNPEQKSSDRDGNPSNNDRNSGLNHDQAANDQKQNLNISQFSDLQSNVLQQNNNLGNSNKVNTENSLNTAKLSSASNLGDQLSAIKNIKSTIHNNRIGLQNNAPSSVSQSDMIEKISRMIALTVTKQISQTNLLVDGGRLGSLEILLQQKDANQEVTVTVESETAREILQKLVPVIQENLAQKEIDIASLNVEVGDPDKDDHAETSDSNGSGFQNENDDEFADEKPTIAMKHFGYNTMEIIA